MSGKSNLETKLDRQSNTMSKTYSHINFHHSRPKDKQENKQEMRKMGNSQNKIWQPCPFPGPVSF